MMVKHWMEKITMCALPEMPMWEAGRLMLDHGLHALPVLEEGRVIGVLTREEALRGMYHPWETELLKPETTSRPEDLALALC